MSISLDLDYPGFKLSAQLVPWDSDIFHFPVAQLSELTISKPGKAEQLYYTFEEWRDTCSVQLVSCRLPHQRLRESMFLEQKGFRFVETVLHPVLERLDSLSFSTDTLVIGKAKGKDIPHIQAIAENAFFNERYHVDPRVDSALGDLRYGRWVRNCLEQTRQHLLKIEDNGSLVGFFIIEFNDEGRAYWHLTAIASDYQGQGYGKRVWLAMLKRHKEEGINSVSTTISARNIPVLNLYSQLRFRFLPPEMTFHWVRS